MSDCPGARHSCAHGTRHQHSIRNLDSGLGELTGACLQDMTQHNTSGLRRHHPIPAKVRIWLNDSAPDDWALRSRHIPLTRARNPHNNLDEIEKTKICTLTPHSFRAGEWRSLESTSDLAMANCLQELMLLASRRTSVCHRRSYVSDVNGSHRSREPQNTPAAQAHG